MNTAREAAERSLTTADHPVGAEWCCPPTAVAGRPAAAVAVDDRGTDDFALLERWRAGDAAAGACLYRRHATGIARFFVTKAPEAAEDLVQETFLGALEALERFRGEASFRTFLYSVARFQLNNYRRARRYPVELSDEQKEHPQPYSASPSAALANARQRSLLFNLVKRMPVDLRVALELHYWEDMSIPEIAEILGLPLNTGYSRLRRAKDVLRRELGATRAATAGEKRPAWRR